jgi:hypothetical protein
MATSMVEMLSKAETREGQSGLNAEIPRRLTARPLGWASRKEVRRSVDEGRSFERDSSPRKKRGKDSEIHAIKEKKRGDCSMRDETESIGPVALR